MTPAPDATPGCVIHDLGVPLEAEEPVPALVEAVRRHRQDTDRHAGDTLVVEAALLGTRTPRADLVPQVLRRADRVLAEWHTPAGVARLVTAWGTPLVDAGARPVGVDEVAFPPDDPAEHARRLLDLTGAAGVMLTSTSSATGVPVALATAGDGRRNDAAALGVMASSAVLVRRPPVDRSATASASVASACGTISSAAGSRIVGDTGTDAVAPHVLEGAVVRRVLGLASGTPDALEAGLPTPGRPEDLEERIARACRVALTPFEAPPPWHPVAPRVGDGLPVQEVTAVVVQTGVRLDAPDDVTLGAAVARVVAALAGEGLSAVPGPPERSPGGARGVVFFVGDDRPSPS